MQSKVHDAEMLDARRPAPPAEQTPGAIPDACTEYGVAIRSLASCSKFPKATRDALLASYEQTSAAWVNVPAAGRAALAEACEQARVAVTQSAAACQ